MKMFFSEKVLTNFCSIFKAEIWSSIPKWAQIKNDKFPIPCFFLFHYYVRNLVISYNAPYGVLEGCGVQWYAQFWPPPHMFE